MDLIKISLIIVSTICIIVSILLWKRYQKQTQINTLYTNNFGHSPDILTMNRWLNYNLDKVIQYIDQVKLSMTYCKNETIVFTGLCQDNGKFWIPFWIPIIEYIGSHFKDYRVLFLENDSNDDTRSLLLNEHLKNKKINVMCNENVSLNTNNCKLDIRSSYKNKENNILERISIIRHFRQICLDRVRKTWLNTTYTVIIDWDLMGTLSLEGFFHSLVYLRNNKADCIAVNSLYNNSSGWHIFDTFPLIDSEYQCESLLLNKHSLDLLVDNRYKDAFIYKRIDPIQVKSAFGGFAIYNSKKIQHVNYTDPMYCKLECEHTTFNRSLRIFINPWFNFLLTKNLT